MNVRVSPDSIKKAIMLEESQKIAKQAVQNQINEGAKRYDTILACALHYKHGFGKKRILEFLKEIIDMHIYTKDRYGVEYQDSSYTEMLRKEGINMDEIEKALDEYAASRGIVY